MAEVIGVIASAISIAGLFKACIEAFEVIKAAQTQELDFHKAVLKLQIEKCRLYTWGEAMGLTNPPSAAQPRPLDTFEFKPLVIDILSMLLRLFSDTSKLQDRYGCCAETEGILSTQLPVASTETDHVGNLSICFSNFRLNNGEVDTSLKKKLKWLVQDRKRFPALVSEAKEFIDGLQDITKSISPASLQTQAAAHRIQRISQPDTLQLVADVCETDHPVLSDAASVRLELVSMAQTRRDEIEQWNNDTEPSEDVFSAVESMTVTEMKHRLLHYLVQDMTTGSEPAENPSQPQPQSGIDVRNSYITDIPLPFRPSLIQHSHTTSTVVRRPVLVGIFKNCVELFSTFATGKPGPEYEILTTKLEIEKALLLQWGARVQLVEPSGYDRRLDHELTNEMVLSALTAIRSLLSDSDALRSRYGVETANPQSPVVQTKMTNDLTQRFMRDFNALRMPRDETQHALSVEPPLRWSIDDKEKFAHLLQDLGFLVAKLEAWVPSFSGFDDNMEIKDAMRSPYLNEEQIVQQMLAEGQLMLAEGLLDGIDVDEMTEEEQDDLSESIANEYRRRYPARGTKPSSPGNQDIPRLLTPSLPNPGLEALDSEEEQSPSPSEMEAPLWDVHKDNILLLAKGKGMAWEEMKRQYFPSISTASCRTRHGKIQAEPRRMGPLSSDPEEHGGSPEASTERDCISSSRPVLTGDLPAPTNFLSIPPLRPRRHGFRNSLDLEYERERRATAEDNRPSLRASTTVPFQGSGRPQHGSR